MPPRTIYQFQSFASIAALRLALALATAAPLVLLLLLLPLITLPPAPLAPAVAHADDASPANPANEASPANLANPANAANPANLDLRLRFTWGGGAERAWQGVVRLDQGQLLDPSPLGREADDPGSIVGNQSQLQIVQGSASTFAGCDFSLHAPLSAQLTIEFAPRDEPTSVRK